MAHPYYKVTGSLFKRMRDFQQGLGHVWDKRNLSRIKQTEKRDT